MKHSVTVFSEYPFTIGEKIRIEGSKRGGDWEVVGINEKNVTLRCPISNKEFSWARFCYFTQKEDKAEWPQKDKK